MSRGRHHSNTALKGANHVRDYRDARIVADYLAGHTTYAIAGVFNISRPRVCQILHERGVPIRKWRNRDVAPKVWTTDRQRAEA